MPGTHTRKNLTILISSLSQNMHTHTQTAAQEQPNRQNKNKNQEKKKSALFPARVSFSCNLKLFVSPQFFFFTASEQHNNKRSESVQSKTCLVFSFLVFFSFCFHVSLKSAGLAEGGNERREDPSNNGGEGRNEKQILQIPKRNQ